MRQSDAAMIALSKSRKSETKNPIEKVEGADVSAVLATKTKGLT